MSTHPLLFMVDDNVSDIDLVRMALDERGCAARIDTARNGDEALVYLRALDAEATSSLVPDLILLDLNMPRIGGIEILTFLSKHARLSSIPVVILTTSDSPRDRSTCMQLGATAYIVKARRFGELVASMSPVVDLLHRSKGGMPPTPPHGSRIAVPSR